MIVVIHTTLPDESAAEIRALSPEIELLFAPRDQHSIPKDMLARAEVVYTEFAPFDPADAPRLKWVQTDSASTQGVRASPVMRSKIPIANAGGAYSVSVTECAMALLLALIRRLPHAMRMQQQNHFPNDLPDFLPFRAEELYGRTMGIVGYGSIGRQIARVASAMGMTILAAKRRPEVRRDDDTFCAPNSGDVAGELPAAWYGIAQLPEMFRRCDVAVATLPSTPDTLKLIRADALAALPKHAYLINVGRGEVIDEAALIERLRSGNLAGAGLDVFAEEPLPKSSPLWTMPNVVILPHVGSYTDRQFHWASRCLKENIRRSLAGEPLINVIDKELLY